MTLSGSPMRVTVTFSTRSSPGASSASSRSNRRERFLLVIAGVPQGKLLMNLSKSSSLKPSSVPFKRFESRF